MRKQHREIAVHLFERGQKALPPLPVEARNPGSERPDRALKIRLLPNERLVFFFGALRILLGPEVHSTQCISLTLQPRYIRFNLVGGRHLIGVCFELLQERLRRLVQILSQTHLGCLNRLARTFGPRLACSPCLARIRRRTLCPPFLFRRSAQCPLASGQRIFRLRLPLLRCTDLARQTGSGLFQLGRFPARRAQFFL